MMFCDRLVPSITGMPAWAGAVLKSTAVARAAALAAKGIRDFFMA
jgi:hypothetical protein